MDKEEGEKRDFLPEFFRNFLDFDVQLYLEKGYGEKLGHTEKDYLDANKNILFVNRETVLKQKLVCVIRVPEFDSLELMQPYSGLLSMLHYDTRPNLLQKLKEKKIHSFSLDSIVNDNNQRLVVSYEMTAYGGVHTAFTHLKTKLEENNVLNRKSLKVSILGMGNLGFQAARYSFQEFNNQAFHVHGVEGISIEFLEKEITQFPNSMKNILQETDILIDATKRSDSTKIIIPNEWLTYLPKYAIILDLTADPYEVREDEIQQKAIEGIPHGNIDKFVFTADDPDWSKNIPRAINITNRRNTISCNAWPSVMAKKTMEVYGGKIWPFVQVILRKGFQINMESEDPNERALGKATIEHFEEALNPIKEITKR